jgi:hypothetical protein
VTTKKPVSLPPVAVSSVTAATAQLLQVAAPAPAATAQLVAPPAPTQGFSFIPPSSVTTKKPFPLLGLVTPPDQVPYYPEKPTMGGNFLPADPGPLATPNVSIPPLTSSPLGVTVLKDRVSPVPGSTIDPTPIFPDPSSQKATCPPCCNTGASRSLSAVLPPSKTVAVPTEALPHKRLRSDSLARMDVDRPCSSPADHLIYREGPYTRETDGRYSHINGVQCIDCGCEVVGIADPGPDVKGGFIYPTKDNPVWVCTSCQNNLLCQSCFVPRMDSFNAAHPGKVARVRRKPCKG